MSEPEREPERIAKVGPIEIYGRRRAEPKEFTELADAIDGLKRAVRWAAMRDAVRIRRVYRRIRKGR